MNPGVFSVRSLQSGQAALEALVLMLVLGVLWMSIAWLGRIHDIALQTSHVSRFAAFLATRKQPLPPTDVVLWSAFDGRGKWWSDHRGEALRQSVYPNLGVDFSWHAAIAPEAQIGGKDVRMAQLRDDWLNTDQGVLSARVSLAPRFNTDGQNDEGSLLRMFELEAAYPIIQRHTSILTGSGHASDDVSSAERIASSTLAWSGPAEQSYRFGRKVASAASNVDAAWHRPQPVFDWLRPWSEYVPSHHLHSER